MRALCTLGVALWLALIAVGFGWLADYESRPGKQGVASESWPLGSRLVRHVEQWNLVLFLHPHCPCSSASLQELVDSLSLDLSDVRACVVMCKPVGVPKGWEESALWKQAASMTGFEVYTDEGDYERRQFGALTSGQVFLYDPRGMLRYHGGITPGRGKTGSNHGRRAIEALLRGLEPPLNEAPVFGCPLVAKEPRR